MERATILIVEDEETQRSLLSGLLQKEGYTVEEAGNGANAIDLFRTKTIDLVLLDFKLPDMDG
ncbi:MAG TPA: response regulator, partial [Syntrophorhabdus sp.]|nr:response regulator [Syntrophorhabdus sp.]